MASGIARLEVAHHFLGRCIDLTKAYKQVAISKKSLKQGVLGYPIGQGDWRLYLSQSFPFGASASVFSFNKITRAIWHILTHKLGLLASVFYDDFPVVELQPLARLSSCAVENVLDALGWKHAVTGGKKATEFSETFCALGVQYDLSGLWKGHVVVQNKPGLGDKILEVVETFREKSSAVKSTASVLAGLLNFAGGFTMGHHLKPASHALSKFLTSEGGSHKDRVNLCDLTSTLLTSMKPRVVSILNSCRPIVIYTDGAYESGTGTWGAMLLDPRDGSCKIFGGRVPQCLITTWNKLVGKQVIGEVEMYAYLCIRFAARNILQGRSGITFIDNEACRYSLIKRSSRNTSMFLLITAVSLIDAAFNFDGWTERVPSASNPADLPSRGKEKKLLQATGGSWEGDIVLPPYLMSFIGNDKFDAELAELLRFEFAA